MAQPVKLNLQIYLSFLRHVHLPVKNALILSKQIAFHVNRLQHLQTKFYIIVNLDRAIWITIVL